MRYFGYDISKFEPSRSPWDAKRDLLKGVSAPVIFDVGACVGATIKRYQKYFPASKIYAFEPFKDTFSHAERQGAKGDNARLRPALSGNTKVFNLALGAVTGKQVFHINSFAPTNSLLPSDDRAPEVWGSGLYETEKTIQVDVERLDDFMERMGIGEIDLLKMDVQGAEYRVLEGAEKAIKGNKIKVIYTEIITVPAYQGQKTVAEMFSLFGSLGFDLYNIFDIYSKDGRITHFDAIFTHRTFKKNIG